MDELKILLAGDFCPQFRVQELIDQKRYDLIFNDFISELQGNDLNLVDLECPLTERRTVIHKTGPHLKGNPRAVDALTHAGIRAVALANNHIRDYGPDGLIDTLELCAQSGIRTVGAGKGIEVARKPLWVEEKGLRIAILNMTENEWSNTNGSEPGANPLNLAKDFTDIRKAREAGDGVIVVYHGGNEFFEFPSPRLKETLRFFVEAGANAVICHHTHVVSGYEVYNGSPIFYSLGNFCFDWPGKRNSAWNIGMAVRLILQKKEAVRFEMIPFRQNDSVAGIHKLTANETDEFFRNLNRINGVIGDDEKLKERFLLHCREKRAIYEIYLEPYRNNWLASLYKRGWIPSFFSGRKRRLYQNIIRCESHRDVLIEILNQT